MFIFEKEELQPDGVGLRSPVIQEQKQPKGATSIVEGFIDAV